MAETSIPVKTKGKKRKTGLIIGLACVGLIGLYLGLGKETAIDSGDTTFDVKRGDLKITVLEGGSIEAAESYEHKSEVQGMTKILTIIDEGVFITPEDVENKKVLIELDSSELVEHQTEQELQYQNALASVTEAREQFDIQVNQNQSDIKAAELESKFAMMDLEKYLGDEIAEQVIADYGIVETEIVTAAIPAAGSEAESAATDTATASSVLPSESEPAPGLTLETVHDPIDLDFTQYADTDKLGDGEARQQLRKLEDDKVLAEEDLGVAKSRLEGTQRLFEKEFVTKIELENDELALQRKAINLDSVKTSEGLFVRYEFPKMAEKLLSDYEESLRKVERARKMAISKLAQAEAKLNSAEARYQLQERKRKELIEQIEKCVIKAERPGLVVYGASRRSYYDNDKIEEGAQVRERQGLITIPDTTQMMVEVSIHEAYIKKVVVGQKVFISTDAYPDVELTGVVTKIAVLPDSQNRWMNPDLKVYKTKITLNENFEWMKPGMSSEAEILITELKDVLYIPLQAVNPEGGEQVCYVSSSFGVERRVIKVGEFNESFIEVTDGLEEGESVYLYLPDTEKEGGDAEGESGKDEKPKEAKEDEKKDKATAMTHRAIREMAA